MPEYTEEELMQVCGRAIGFVLAPTAGCAATIEPATKALRNAGCPAIFVMADLSCADQAVEAVRHLQRKGRPMIQAAEFDFSLVTGAHAPENGEFHLQELPQNLLHVMAVLSESVLDVYELVVVVDATHPAPTEEDIYDLCAMLRKKNSPTEVVLEVRADPSPYALSRRFLDDLSAES